MMVRVAWVVVLASTAALAVQVPVASAIEQNVVVVLDDSGSMENRMRTPQGPVARIEAAKRALREVLAGLPPETNVGILALNSQVDGDHWIAPLGPLQGTEWQSNLERLRAAGGTPLGEFLKRGADALLEARSRQIYGTFRLLVVTDGEANDENLVEAYLPDILSRGLVVDVIGVDMLEDHSLATRVHNYRRADDDAALSAAISEVFAETSSDGQDAEADFDMLAGLPDEFASEAIRALGQKRNEPIEAVGRGNRGNAWIADGAGSGSGSGVGSSVVTLIGGFLCCMFGMFLLAGLVLVLIISRRPRR